MRSGGDLGLRMHGVCFPAMVFWFRWGRECEGRDEGKAHEC